MKRVVFIVIDALASRVVDVAPLCLAVLGIKSHYPVGASHLDGEHRV